MEDLKRFIGKPIREVVQAINPEKTGRYGAGVRGCPTDYPYLGTAYDGCCKQLGRCTTCWDQVFTEWPSEVPGNCPKETLIQLTLDQKAKDVSNYLSLYASRGALETAAVWYYKAIGKPGKEAHVSRYELEILFYLMEVLDISSDWVYQLLKNDEPYRHQYYSAAEVLRYLMNNADVVVSDKWEGLPVGKNRDLITVKNLGVLSPKV